MWPHVLIFQLNRYLGLDYLIINLISAVGNRGRFAPGRGAGFRNDERGRGNYGGGRGFGRGDFNTRPDFGGRGGGRGGYSNRGTEVGYQRVDHMGPSGGRGSHTGSSGISAPAKN